MRLPFTAARRLRGSALALAGLLLVAGCAQQRSPGRYQSATPSGTVSDAMHQAQGGAAVIAPSQIQLGFGSDAPGAKARAQAGTQGDDAPAAVPAASAPAELADTRSYLGTMPCLQGTQCQATRMTLTLAPDGQWRGRSAPLSGGKPGFNLGCWYLVGHQPLRIVLQAGDNAVARLEFTSGSVLRVLSVNGQRPLLEHTLTRQADIDPIDELSSRPAEACDKAPA